MQDNYNVDKNGWNEWSKHVLIQLKTLVEEVKELRELRHTDKEALSKSIQEIKDDMQLSMTAFDTTVQLIKQEAELKAKNKATNVATVISVTVSVISGIILFVVTSFLK